MSGRRHRAAWLLAAAAVLLGLTACQVPLDDEPRPLSAEDVAVGPPGPPASAAGPAPAARQVRIYLLRDTRLVAVNRRVDASKTGPAVAVEALLAGPLPGEVRAGLRSALGSETGARVTGVDGGVVTVGLARDLTGMDLSEQILALAQLVFTVTDHAGMRAVRVTLDGSFVELPTSRGELTGRPLTRADFAPMAPS